MNQIFNEIDEDLKQERFINFFKKYKFIIIISLSLFVLTIAAAESSIGLAILVVYYRMRGTIAVEFKSSLLG